MPPRTIQPFETVRDIGLNDIELIHPEREEEDVDVDSEEEEMTEEQIDINAELCSEMVDIDRDPSKIFEYVKLEDNLIRFSLLVPWLSSQTRIAIIDLRASVAEQMIDKAREEKVGDEYEASIIRIHDYIYSLEQVLEDEGHVFVSIWPPEPLVDV